MAVISSTKLGVVLLGLLAVYLSLASTLPQMRTWLDTTEQGVYGWWPHVALWFALCVNLSAATVVRVPLRLQNAGAWLAHAGVLCVAVGSVWYVSHKIDGDILVRRLPQGGFETADYFHDATLRALYAAFLPPEGSPPNSAAGASLLQTPLMRLPLNRSADNLSLPAFTPDNSARLTVTGYRPHADVTFVWRDGGPTPRPGAVVTIAFRGERQPFVLVAGDEQAAGVEGPGFQLLYRPELSATQIETLLAPGKPTHVLRVSYRGKLVRAALPVMPGQSVELPEIGYRLQVLAFHYRWQESSETQPAQNASPRQIPSLLLRVTPLEPTSAPATAAVEGKPHLSFHRIVQAGLPQATTDFDMAAVADRMPEEGTLVDKDLAVDYSFNESPAVNGDVLMLAGGGATAPVLLRISPDGQRSKFDVRVGEPVDVPYGAQGAGDDSLSVTVAQWYSHAVLRGELLPSMVEPRPMRAEKAAAIRVRVQAGDWSDEQWLPFAGEPSDAHPHTLALPDGRRLQLQFTRFQRPLGATLQVEGLTFDAYPGTNTPRDYICRMSVLDGAAARPVEVRLNKPVMVGGYRVSQQGWDMSEPENPGYTVLGVTNRPGISIIWLGCVLIVLALPYAFYVKPILKRRAAKAATGGAA